MNNRILQLFWGAVGLGLACGIDYIGTQLGLFDLPIEVVGILTVVIPVITKAIRNYVVANYTLP